MAMIANSPDNQAIRELRDELKDLNRSLKASSKIGERLTAAMFVLAMIQVLVAVFQLILSFAYSDNLQPKVLGVAMVLATVAILSYFFRMIFPKKTGTEIENTKA